jgi:endonuclease III
MNPEKRRQIFERLRAINPHPTTELKYGNVFQLLVAVILSAQATDKGVNKATEKLFKVVTRPRDVLTLGEEGLKDYVKTIGLFNGKTRNILATAQILEERYAGEVPRERAALEALPGVGRKTANVILNTAFGEPAIAVDTHIFRVANRTGLAPGRTPLEVERRLLRFVADDFKHDAHHWLILLGRYICVARTPKCPECPINDLCEYRAKTTYSVAEPKIWR